jgi:UDP-2,3-diacylglucosamine hydrolase
MLAAMLSDAHLIAADDPVQAWVVRWLDELETDHCYLLGDLFHFWWAFEGEPMPEFAAVLAALARLRGRGIPLTLLRGNHDFRLGRFFADELGATVADEVEVQLGSRRYLLIHGDQPDSSLGYRVTRRILRGSLFDRFMRTLGTEGVRKVGHALAGASRHYGDEPTRLLRAQQAWASERLAGPIDVVVMGHSHVLGRWQLPGGSLFNLGDFARDRTWLAVTADGPTLRTFS